MVDVECTWFSIWFSVLCVVEYVDGAYWQFAGVERCCVFVAVLLRWHHFERW